MAHKRWNYFKGLINLVLGTPVKSNLLMASFTEAGYDLLSIVVNLAVP